MTQEKINGNQWLQAKANRQITWRRFYFKWKNSEKVIVNHMLKIIPKDLIELFQSEV